MKIAKKFFRKTNNKKFFALSKRLQKRSDDLVVEFANKHKDALDYLESKGFKVDVVVSKGSRGAATGAAAAVVLLSSGLVPSRELPAPKAIEQSPNQIVSDVIAKQDKSQSLVKAFTENLPRNARVLNSDTEKKLADSISANLGIKVTPELEGNHLNTTYGKIGLEQHLPRYPGESISQHFESGNAASIYGKSGMTRNRGAFGYFAANRYSLTKEAIEQEKYYVVVQSFDIPGWNSKKADWYKHRKVLVVNTENGRAVVGDIGDSGPAKWTGKSFGGSPELMDNLEMYRGNRSAKVLIFFIDNGADVKLGPI